MQGIGIWPRRGSETHFQMRKLTRSESRNSLTTILHLFEVDARAARTCGDVLKRQRPDCDGRVLANGGSGKGTRWRPSWGSNEDGKYRER